MKKHFAVNWFRGLIFYDFDNIFVTPYHFLSFLSKFVGDILFKNFHDTSCMIVSDILYYTDTIMCYVVRAMNYK